MRRRNWFCGGCSKNGKSLIFTFINNLKTCKSGTRKRAAKNMANNNVKNESQNNDKTAVIMTNYNAACFINDKAAKIVLKQYESGAITFEIANEKFAAIKPKSAKNLANEESKQEMFSKSAALRAVKTAFDIKESQTRAYILALGFTANAFKQLEPEKLDIHSKSGVKFSTWEVLNAVKRFAEEHDLTGERAEKEQRKAERARLAEVRKLIKEQKAAERAKEQKAREEKSAKHLAVAKAANATKAAEIAEAKQKADAKAARRLAKRNK